MEKLTKIQIFFDKAVVFLFFAVLAIIFLGQLIGITSGNDFIERRSIDPFPALDFRNPKIITDLDSYFSVNFGFRNVLLKGYLYIKMNLLKTHKIYTIDFNDQGLFFGAIYLGSDYKVAYDNVLYTQNQLNSWREIFEREKAHLEAQNIPYFLVIIPDRRIVYSDLLPFQDNLALIRHRQIVDFMRERSSIVVIDPLSELLKAKGSYPLYFNTDTHWTNYAAYVVYLDIMNNLAKFRDVKPYQKEDFDISQEKYDIWLGDGGFNYPANPGSPDHGVKFALKKDSMDKYSKLNSILEYGDSFTNIDRRICLPCLTNKFPQIIPIIPLLFKEIDDPNLINILDPRPGYWYPKYNVEKLASIIREKIADKTAQDRIINYLLSEALLPDPIGLDYFFRLSFNKVLRGDLTVKIDQSAIDQYKPDLVIREAIDNRVWEFSRLKCNYEKDSNFNKYYSC